MNKKYLLITIVAFFLVLMSVRSKPSHAETRSQPIEFETVAELEAFREPTSANPYFAFLPDDVVPDYEYWGEWMRLKGIERGQNLATPARTVNHVEMEASNATGANDTLASAEPVANFGTGAGDDPVATIIGSLPGASVGGNTISEFPENDGSIPLANQIAVPDGEFVFYNSEIGNGPYGSAGTGSGDFDFFELTGFTIGDVLEIQVETDNPAGDLDPDIAIWDAQVGRLLAFHEDNDTDNNDFDNFIRYVVPASGSVYLSVHGFRTNSATGNLPANPFVSASGQGVGSEGDYKLLVGKNLGDLDHFEFDLEAGDIIGANLESNRNSMVTRLFDPSGGTLISADTDGSAGYGAGAPLPGGGKAAYAFVAETTGTYSVQVMGSPNATYSLELYVFRPSLESDPAGSKQILFLDFDGATIDALAIFGRGNANAVLSPFATFLPDWGLAAGDESAVINAIIATVQEGLDSDIDNNGNNPKFDIEIRNSRDHADPFGQPNVTRMIIGGTIAQLGIQTVGIAQSIDVGNFAHEETAVVLIDIMSAATGSSSFNSYALAGGTSKIDIVGVGVGNIINHEAGHYFGNWHTDQFNSVPNLMDQGGNMAFSILGVGPDNIFGSADDVDVDHVTDTYNPSELYGGNENTLNEIAFALSTPDGAATAVTLQAQSDAIRTPLGLMGMLLVAVVGLTMVVWIRPKSSR